MADPTSTYRMIIAAVSAGDLDSLDQLIAPDLVDTVEDTLTDDDKVGGG